jgi:starch synthase (maltosyl-transferring)
MYVPKQSRLTRLMEFLEKNISKGEKIKYSVPDLWDCFHYTGEEKEAPADGLISVNPYKFYYSCIKDYILPNCDPEIDYSRSISNITHFSRSGADYLPGDWVKESSIYSMHIRTSTSWDHNGSGLLEDENEYGLKETGTFVKTICLLPLLKKMGIDVLYLLPLTKHSLKNKKGEIGSPYSVKSFFELDPELKDTITGEEFTIDDEFGALIEACHMVGIKVMIDIIPRTCSRDNDLIMEHPEWFYWIRTKDLPFYKTPYVPGANAAEKPSLSNLHLIYQSGEVWDLIKKFTVSPDQFDSKKWAKLKKMYQKDNSIDFLDFIEKEIGLTTAPAFPDCLNDPQPPWSDVTFLRLYMDHPVPSRNFMRDPDQAPYILFDTIKGNIFKGEIRNEELWDKLSGIIPHFQNNYGVDGARVDMGHALPEELVQMILHNARNIDKEFSFIAEELIVESAEAARKAGYNMIIGSGFIDEPRAYEHQTHKFMYDSKFIKAAVYASAETSDTPRVAARDGGRFLSKFLTVMNQFVPNAVPFINSGLELYETQPMNTGLDCRPDEAYRLHSADPYFGKLAFFDKYQFHWTNPLRWDIPDTLEEVSKYRKMFLDTFTDTNNFIPLGCGDVMLPFIGLGWLISGRKWNGSDNLFLAIANTDIMHDREFTVDLGEARKAAGNYLRKAWLAYSSSEKSGEIYDFDGNGNLKLKFKPAEVKLIML